RTLSGPCPELRPVWTIASFPAVTGWLCAGPPGQLDEVGNNGRQVDELGCPLWCQPVLIHRGEQMHHAKAIDQARRADLVEVSRHGPACGGRAAKAEP